MEHRADGLQIYGNTPEIQDLYNDRYRMVVRCTLPDNNEAWFYDNRDEIWAGFDTLMDAPFGGAGATPDDDSTYPNMRLVQLGLEYAPQIPFPLLVFTYETLTSGWVKEVEDVKGSTENGLRTLTRVQVARINTAAPYDEDDVGVSTITDNGKTLYLAGLEDQSASDDAVQIGRFVTRWAEAGTLRERTSYAGDGKYNKEITFLGVEGSVDGIIIDRDTQNFDGFQTIVVSTLEAANGGDITNAGNPVVTHEVEWDFDYPGEVSIGTKTSSIDIIEFDPITGTETVIGTINYEDYFFDIKPPSQNVPIEATRYVFYQTSNQIVASDKTYGGASGRWALDESANGSIEMLGCTYNSAFNNVTSVFPASQSQAFSNYVAVSPKSATAAGYDLATNTFRSVEGSFCYPRGQFTIAVDGGPDQPEGNTYVLDISLQEDFETPDGTKYYKKEIVVATIPTRPI